MKITLSLILLMALIIGGCSTKPNPTGIIVQTKNSETKIGLVNSEMLYNTLDSNIEEKYLFIDDDKVTFGIMLSIKF